MHQASPGVERAVAAAAAWAARRGSPAVRLSDYVLGLLDEEEGRPAELLTRAGGDLTAVRQRFEQLTGPVPVLRTLYDAARDWSLRHRADPAFMTDALLLAVLTADEDFAHAAAAAGLDAVQLFGRMVGGVNDPFDRLEPPTATFSPPDAADDLAAARVLDANLNRSRESLRVLDDHCRFVLNDRTLTEQVKAVRHALAAATDQLPSGLLLAARDTPGDVGTAVTAGGEYERGSPAQVAAVNLKRLQEALRSVEEHGKLLSPAFAREVESLRYRTYTLERAVVRGTDARRRLADARLYVLLTGSQCAAALDWTIAQAAAGGATVFQLREKELPDAELIARARDVRRWTRQANALFVVNDRPDIARLVGADGVHVGQDDLPVADARRVVGPDVFVGVSTHNVAQLRQAVLDGADYLGVGPTFPSRTKVFDEFPGLAFVRAAAAETSLPVFALGGVGPANVASVVAAGLRRIAVSAAVCQADDPEAVARILRAALDLPGAESFDPTESRPPG
ncbi:MAG: thiamine phosphate synthase [Gemmataceae bacterium]